MKKLSEFLGRNMGWVIFTVFVFSALSPYIFTRSSLWKIDFSETGQIGDTIGGLVSPFLNLLSIILLYITLKDQSKSAQSQRDFDGITHLQNTIKSDIERLTFIKKGTNQTYVGYQALFEISETFRTSKNVSNDVHNTSLRSFYFSFAFTLANINRLLERNASSTVSDYEKKLVYDMLSNLKTPVLMVCTNAGYYYENVKQATTENLSELDNTMALFPIVGKMLEDSFEKNKQA